MRRKKGCSCINMENGVDAWNRKQGLMHHFWMRGRRSAHPAPKTWCSMTKEQDFAGSEAPRQVRRRRLEFGRRGARRRRNKVLRGAKHHVRYAGGALGPKDVVLDDEETRFCGRQSTTPPRRSPARRPAALQLGNSPNSRRQRLAPHRRPTKKGPTHSRSP